MKQPKLADHLRRAVSSQGYGYSQESGNTNTATSNIPNVEMVENAAIEFLQLMGRSREETYEELLQLLKTKVILKLQQGVTVFAQRHYQHVLLRASIWLLPCIKNRDMREVFDALVCAMAPNVPDDLLELLSRPLDLGVSVNEIKEYCKDAPDVIVKPLLMRNPSWFLDVKSSKLISAMEALRESSADLEDDRILEQLRNFINRSDATLYRIFLRAAEEMAIRNLRSAASENLVNSIEHLEQPSDELANRTSLSSSQRQDLSRLSTYPTSQEAKIKIEDTSQKPKENHRRPIGNSYISELVFLVSRSLPSLQDSGSSRWTGDPCAQFSRWVRQTSNCTIEIKAKKLLRLVDEIRLDGATSLFLVSFAASSPTIQHKLTELALEAALTRSSLLSELSVPMTIVSDICIALACMGLSYSYFIPFVFPHQSQYNARPPTSRVPPKRPGRPPTLRCVLENLLSSSKKTTILNSEPNSSSGLRINEMSGGFDGLVFLTEVLAYRNNMAQLFLAPPDLAEQQSQARTIFAKLHSQFKAIHLHYLSVQPGLSPADEQTARFCTADLSYNISRQLIATCLVEGLNNTHPLAFHYAVLELNSFRWQNGADFHYDFATRMVLRAIRNNLPIGGSKLSLIKKAFARKSDTNTERLAFEWFTAASDSSLPAKRLEALSLIVEGI